jgi:hypothetical protein
MTAFSDWLVDKATLLLDPDERDVVRGDLTETGESGARAIVDVLGLVVRRQAAEWKTLPPWLALGLLAAPLGMLLSLISRYWADGTSEIIWQVSHGSDDLRLDLFLMDYIALAGWGWTCGFAIGCLSPRSSSVNVLLFLALVFVGTVGSSEVMRNDTRVFESLIFGQLMPFVVRVLFVAVPAWHGVRRSLDRRPLRVAPVLLVTLALAAIAVARTKWIEASGSFFGWRPFGPLPHPGFDGRIGTDDDIIDWKLRLLPFVVMWPAVYILATTLRERLWSFDAQRRTR